MSHTMVSGLGMPRTGAFRAGRAGPDPVDRHVGARVRMRRMMLGLSQEKLGDALGLTFQQVQKYEKGTNRISASRLAQIAQFLKIPVGFLFDGAPGFAAAGAETGAAPDLVAEFFALPHAAELAEFFLAFASNADRRALADVARAIARAKEVVP